METVNHFPEQMKSFSQKGVKWRKKCVDWALGRTYLNYSPVRKSVRNMKINQDLVNGILHMDDVMRIVNPSGIEAEYIPDYIQHYPIMNSKLNVLQGEEAKRMFDWKVVVTNPNSISEIENNKKKEMVSQLQSIIENNSESEEEFNQAIEKMDYFFNFEWQDMRESRANALLTHYIKELHLPLLFNRGFTDAMKFGEEIYDVDIVGGEPYVERLNPMKVRVFRSGYSNHIEDADIVILEDYWQPGRIIDHYQDVLKPEDIKYIESIPNSIDSAPTDSAGNFDERYTFVHKGVVTEEENEEFCSSLFNNENIVDDLMPYDLHGNVRVIRVFWKSRRKIKKVKSYDEDGNTIYTLYPETYITKEELGEEEKILWVNEAWEGTLIGEKVYVNMRPRVVQYNRLSNPSRCHFGIVGTIYNKNDDKPYSLVDMMKPYSYAYDAIHDRLNKLMERNWGKIVSVDLAQVPAEWGIDKWLYFAKVNGIAVKDSFKESAYGKPVGALNSNSTGVIDAELGNTIQMNITLLEFLKGEMGEVAGISKQREGQISNRETVGGVERATLQSSHITEWLFQEHEDLKQRVLEVILETAKIALKGHKKKFQYILSDGQQRIMEIDGDEFAECDYGLVVDNGQDTQKLNQNLEVLAQSAIQNQYSLSSVMKLFTSNSMMEKIRILEREEQKRLQQAQQQSQQEMQLKQQELEQKQALEQAKMEQEYKMNQENNDTRVLVAEINSQAEADRLALMNKDDGIQEMSEEARARIKEMAREHDDNTKLAQQRLAFDKDKAEKDRALKAKIAANKPKTPAKK